MTGFMGMIFHCWKIIPIVFARNPHSFLTEIRRRFTIRNDNFEKLGGLRLFEIVPLLKYCAQIVAGSFSVIAGSLACRRTAKFFCKRPALLTFYKESNDFNYAKKRKA